MGTHPIFESDFDCLTETIMESADEINRDYLRTLKHRLFVSRKNNKKIEQSFQAHLNEVKQPVVTGNCSLIAKNANHPQGQAMSILIGLEYTMYRYLNVNAAYDPHLSKRHKVDIDPLECVTCGVDFTIQWCRNPETGQTQCYRCAREPVLGEIKRQSRDTMKRAIVACYADEVEKSMKKLEAKKARQDQFEEIGN